VFVKKDLEECIDTRSVRSDFLHPWHQEERKRKKYIQFMAAQKQYNSFGPRVGYAFIPAQTKRARREERIMASEPV